MDAALIRSYGNVPVSLGPTTEVGGILEGAPVVLGGKLIPDSLRLAGR